MHKQLRNLNLTFSVGVYVTSHAHPFTLHNLPCNLLSLEVTQAFSYLTFLAKLFPLFVCLFVFNLHDFLVFSQKQFLRKVAQKYHNHVVLAWFVIIKLSQIIGTQNNTLISSALCL